MTVQKNAKKKEEEYTMCFGVFVSTSYSVIKSNSFCQRREQ